MSRTRIRYRHLPTAWRSRRWQGNCRTKRIHPGSTRRRRPSPMTRCHPRCFFSCFRKQGMCTRHSRRTPSSWHRIRTRGTCCRRCRLLSCSISPSATPFFVRLESGFNANFTIIGAMAVRRGCRTKRIQNALTFSFNRTVLGVDRGTKRKNRNSFFIQILFTE